MPRLPKRAKIMIRTEEAKMMKIRRRMKARSDWRQLFHRVPRSTRKTCNTGRANSLNITKSDKFIRDILARLRR